MLVVARKMKGPPFKVSSSLLAFLLRQPSQPFSLLSFSPSRWISTQLNLQQKLSARGRGSKPVSQVSWQKKQGKLNDEAHLSPPSFLSVFSRQTSMPSSKNLRS